MMAIREMAVAVVAAPMVMALGVVADHNKIILMRFRGLYCTCNWGERECMYVSPTLLTSINHRF